MKSSRTTLDILKGFYNMQEPIRSYRESPIHKGVVDSLRLRGLVWSDSDGRSCTVEEWENGKR